MILTPSANERVSEAFNALPEDKKSAFREIEEAALGDTPKNRVKEAFQALEKRLQTETPIHEITIENAILGVSEAFNLPLLKIVKALGRASEEKEQPTPEELMMWFQEFTGLGPGARALNFLFRDFLDQGGKPPTQTSPYLTKRVKIKYSPDKV